MGIRMFLLFAVVTIAAAMVLEHGWRTGARGAFVPGQTTSGHYQIELSCNACHTAMEGVKQDACTGCHGEDLKASDDSHPRSKFTDPRNADRVEKLDARLCVTCHVEHRPESTAAMGVTQPVDYCRHCHEDIAEERPSHEGMAFHTCASAGCHNFHDNRTLHEDYLASHLGEPAHKAAPVLALTLGGRKAARDEQAEAPAGKVDARHGDDESLLAQWRESSHAQVDCVACHGEGAGWSDAPSIDACADCHESERAGFGQGRHGMRIGQGLSPMTPAQARAPMGQDAPDGGLGCNSCHAGHAQDRSAAAARACLGCHDDSHSRAYEASPHGRLWRAELGGQGPEGSGVSCATCHMPRVATGGETQFSVQHNQNHNLRPNEKMIREVCAECHGVPFAIDALADRHLIDRNFSGQPAAHVRSVDLVEHKLSLAKPQPGAASGL